MQCMNIAGNPVSCLLCLFIGVKILVKTNAFISNLYCFKLSILLLFSCSYAKFSIHTLNIIDITEWRITMSFANMIKYRRVPLFNSNFPLILFWSQKSGCTSLAHWFFYQINLF
ncbi:TPA: hypothetical protein ACGXGE_005781, partial [Bacillus pacificus]